MRWHAFAIDNKISSLLLFEKEMNRWKTKQFHASIGGGYCEAVSRTNGEIVPKLCIVVMIGQMEMNGFTHPQGVTNMLFLFDWTLNYAVWRKILLTLPILFSIKPYVTVHTQSLDMKSKGIWYTGQKWGEKYPSSKKASPSPFSLGSSLCALVKTIHKHVKSLHFWLENRHSIVCFD